MLPDFPDCRFPIQESVVTRSKVIATVLGLALGFPAIPALAAWQCSIHPPKGAPDQELISIAQVPRALAQKTALARVGRGARLLSTELEAKRGCLVWSIDVKGRGHEGGLRQISVDAGNGKVLEDRYEHPGQKAPKAGP